MTWGNESKIGVVKINCLVHFCFLLCPWLDIQLLEKDVFWSKVRSRKVPPSEPEICALYAFLWGNNRPLSSTQLLWKLTVQKDRPC